MASNYTINVSPGATFNDIHDNENVYLTVAEGKTLIGEGNEQIIRSSDEPAAEAKRDHLPPLKLNDDTEGMKEALKPFFKPVFYGVGGIRIDYLSYLVDDMSTLSTHREVAMLALMIHNSSSFKNSSERTFTRWYRKFCDIVHSPCLKSLRPSRLAPTETMKSTFSYL